MREGKSVEWVDRGRGLFERRCQHPSPAVAFEEAPARVPSRAGSRSAECRGPAPGRGTPFRPEGLGLFTNAGVETQGKPKAWSRGDTQGNPSAGQLAPHGTDVAQLEQRIEHRINVAEHTFDFKASRKIGTTLADFRYKFQISTAHAWRLTSDVKDEGQISKLLSRLEHHGLLANTGGYPASGNAWQLTGRGEQVLSAGMPSDRELAGAGVGQ